MKKKPFKRRTDPVCPRCKDRPKRYRGYCRPCWNAYMRERRATGIEAERVRERYQTDPEYREHRKALARKHMAKSRAKKAAA